MDLGLGVGIRYLLGLSCAGELLQSDLESPLQKQFTRLIPSRQAVWRSDWLLLMEESLFFFPRDYIQDEENSMWACPLLVKHFHGGPMWYQFCMAGGNFVVVQNCWSSSRYWILKNTEFPFSAQYKALFCKPTVTSCWFPSAHRWGPGMSLHENSF